MRQKAANADIRATMAAYGITITELARHMGTGRSHTSVILAQTETSEKHRAKIWAAIDELIQEGKG